jgi:UDPglucose 6-dehydrogenase
LGYGGYCFPKDLAAFDHLSRQLGYDFALLREVAAINDQILDHTFHKIEDALWNLEGKKIALLGLAFKPETDDVRLAPALRLARKLLDQGAEVVGYDPQAGGSAKEEVPDLAIANDAYSAIEGAHCAVICTEWDEFRTLDLEQLERTMAVPLLVDARNVLEPEAVRSAGITYLPIGRPSA